MDDSDGKKVIFNDMLNHFSINGLLISAQLAYRPGHSISTALVHMADHWVTHMNDMKPVGTGVIDHRFLIVQIKCYRSPPSAAAWMKSHICGSFSDSGVSQGSGFGSLVDF